MACSGYFNKLHKFNGIKVKIYIWKFALMSVVIFTSGFVQAESIDETPIGVNCILSGTGVGTCDIVFPDSTISSCPNTSRVNFDPANGVLGREVYSMALAAVSVSKTLYIGLLPCNDSGKAQIDYYA